MLKKIWDWIKNNKVLSAVIGVLALPAILFLVFMFFVAVNFFNHSAPSPGMISSPSSPLMHDSGPSISSPFDSHDSFYEEAPEMDMDTGRGFDDYDITDTYTEVEIKEGRMTAESEDAERDFERLKDYTAAEGGYVEDSSQSKTSRSLVIRAQVRVPTENFDSFTEKLQNNYEVESFSFQDYRVDVQRQLDEISIIRQTLEDYDQMRLQLGEAEVDSTKISTLRSITDQMQHFASQKKRLQRELGSVQRRADLATVNVTFREDIKPSFWPEDIGERFVDRLSWAVENIILTLTGVLVNGLVLLVKVLEYILYFFIIVIPVMCFWKLFMKVKKRLTNKG